MEHINEEKLNIIKMLGDDLAELVSDQYETFILTVTVGSDGYINISHANDILYRMDAHADWRTAHVRDK